MNPTIERIFIRAVGIFLGTVSPAWAGVTVAMTSPSNGATVNAPVMLSATASATQGYSVTKVEFFDGTTLIGTDIFAPYSISWTNPSSGSHVITAKATATKGSSTQAAMSSPVSVTVNAPSVTINSPANGANFDAPANILFSANASSNNASIASVRLSYYPLNSVGHAVTVTEPPYEAVINLNPSCCDGEDWNSGFYTFVLVATATDTLGASSQATVEVKVTPSVTITSPVNGATFSAPASIPVEVTASATINQVKLYRNSTLVGTKFSPPYTFSLDNVAAGSHTLTAEAFLDSNCCAQRNSLPINVTVVEAGPTIFGETPKDVTLAGSALPEIGAAYASQGSTIDLASVRLELNGQDVTSLATVTPAGVLYQAPQPLAATTHTVSLSVGDAGGGVTNRTWSFAVDEPAPKFYNEAPRDVSLVDRNPRIRVQLSGFDIVPSSIRMMVDGVDVTAQADVSGGRIVFTPATALANGSHSVSVSATDGRGVSAAKQWAFVVAQPPPPSTTSDGVRTGRSGTPQIRVVP